MNTPKVLNSRLAIYFLLIKWKSLPILDTSNSFGIAGYGFTSIRHPKMWLVDPPVSGVALGLLKYKFTIAVTASRRSSQTPQV